MVLLSSFRPVSSAVQINRSTAFAYSYYKQQTNYRILTKAACCQNSDMKCVLFTFITLSAQQNIGKLSLIFLCVDFNVLLMRKCDTSEIPNDVMFV